MLRLWSYCSYLHVGTIHAALLVLSLIGGGDYLAQQARQGMKTASTVKVPDGPKTSKSRAETSSELAMPRMTGSAFVGADRVWLVDTRASALQRTDDAGRSWQKLPSDEITQDTVLSFIDGDNGWRVGKSSGEAGHVWTTADGGKSWTKISIIVSNGRPFLTPRQLHFADKAHGWLLETFGVWRTEDGGASWIEVLSTRDPRVKGQPARGFFMNERQAWIAGTAGQVYATADGGNTWNIQAVDSGSDFSDIFFVDAQTGWLGRNHEGQLYRTDDGGRSWHSQPVPGHMIGLDSFYFVSKDEGWAVGEQFLEGSQGLMPVQYIAKGLVQAILLHTVDGGKTWQPSLVEKSEPFFGRVYFSDREHGWLLSPRSLYRTADGGRSWQVALRSNEK